MPLAFTRSISPRFAECELTFAERVSIDLPRATAQHDAYAHGLKSLGCTVVQLPALPDHPDSVFVEDTAFVLPEVVVITRPGAASRRGEVDSIAEALRPHRELAFVEAPATVDGGDVLVLGKDIYIGLSTRSNVPALSQVHLLVSRFGYRVFLIPIRGCLHLKSAATRIGEDSVLINPRWVDTEHFKRYNRIEIDPSEPHAANILSLEAGCLYPDCYPRTQERLERGGFHILPLNMSELIKAEGAVTCCSLIL